MDTFLWNILYFVLGSALTLAVGWSNVEELKAVVGKLPDIVVEAIRDSEKKKLTLSDLEELIHAQGFYPVEGGS
jgi:hypothetical protein